MHTRLRQQAWGEADPPQRCRAQYVRLLDQHDTGQLGKLPEPNNSKQFISTQCSRQYRAHGALRPPRGEQEKLGGGKEAHQLASYADRPGPGPSTIPEDGRVDALPERIVASSVHPIAIVTIIRHVQPLFIHKGDVTGL